MEKLNWEAQLAVIIESLIKHELNKYQAYKKIVSLIGGIK